MKEIKCPKCGEVFQVDESGYAEIVKQVRDKEFTKQIQEREKQFQAEKEAAIKTAKLETEKEMSKKIEEIEKKDLAKDTEIEKLKGLVSSTKKENEIAIKDAVSQKVIELNEKAIEIEKLKSEIINKEKDSELKTQNLKTSYETQLKLKDEEIEKYKDFKAKQNVKLLGEDLEKHCEIAFNTVRPIGFANAYFEKDNDAKTGSKGDYIYRDFDEEGTEFVSIMFEMKNESDVSSTKKKNEDFFKELNKDRNEKNCEYAVLVSMLEPDNEQYNQGICDVSHRYPKMYVIRPQFFIPFITFVRNTAMHTLSYKKELSIIKNQEIAYCKYLLFRIYYL